MLVRPGRGGIAAALFAACGLVFSVSAAWAVGELTQKPGTAGCISQGGIGGCQPGIGLIGAMNVAVSPDGKNVYVASRGSNSVSSFKRSPDGALEQLPGAGCISQNGEGGCQPGIGLDRANGVAVSPDGKNVYVASIFSSAVAIFSRHPDGTLEQLPDTAGCISTGGLEGCRPGTGLNFPFGIALSPDGNNVYVASAGSATLVILSRNPDGTLEQSPDAAGCISQGGGGECQPGIGLNAANSVAVSADGKSVYVASRRSDAVAIFRRNPDGTLEQLPGTAGCISQGGGGGCQPGIGLDDVSSVATSADGKNVYAASSDSDAVAILKSNPDGSLTQVPGTGGCISQAGVGGCQPGIGLDFASGVAPSADGKSIYVVSPGSGEGSDAVAIFDRAVPPPPADTTAPTISGFKLAPKRFKAAPKGRSSFRFTLSESAALKIKIDRVRPGRKLAKRCQKPTPKLAKRPRCKRFVGVGKALSFQALTAGANKIAFSGKLSGRALKPGLYRASITAKDAAGNRSAPKSAKFTVLQQRR